MTHFRRLLFVKSILNLKIFKIPYVKFQIIFALLLFNCLINLPARLQPYFHGHHRRPEVHRALDVGLVLRAPDLKADVPFAGLGVGNDLESLDAAVGEQKNGVAIVARHLGLLHLN